MTPDEYLADIAQRIQNLRAEMYEANSRLRDAHRRAVVFDLHGTWEQAELADQAYEKAWREAAALRPRFDALRDEQTACLRARRLQYDAALARTV